MLDNIENRLKALIPKNEIMTDKHLETAALMFVYLFSDMRAPWEESLKLIRNVFSKSPRTTLLLISNLEPRDDLGKYVKTFLLSVLTNNLEFKFENIDKFMLPAKMGIRLVF